MINRQEALEFLNEKVENKNIIKHMLATEVLMKAMYQKVKKEEPSYAEASEGEWAIAGLLHDGDYSPSVPHERQGIQVTEWLREKGYEVPENVAYAMAAHNWSNTKVEPKSKMDWALFCGDSLTGLIVASALVLPSKKLSELKVDSILKRFKESSFAKGTRREDIAKCQEKLGIPLEEFVKITLESMQSISNELGL